MNHYVESYKRIDIARKKGNFFQNSKSTYYTHNNKYNSNSNEKLTDPTSNLDTIETNNHFWDKHLKQSRSVNNIAKNPTHALPRFVDW